MQLKPVYLVLVVVVLLPLDVLFRAIKWRFLFPESERPQISSFIRAYVTGVLANSLLLSKLGDLVKARVVCDSRVDFARSIAIVLIDRLLEGAALLLLFAFVLLNSSLPHWTYRLGWVAGFASLGVLITLLTLLLYRDRFLKATERVLSFLPGSLRSQLLMAVQRLVAGCEVLTDPRRVLVAFPCAFIVWGLEISMVSVFLTAFSIPAPQFSAAVVLMTVVNFGMLVPISPGSVGVYQLLCALALSLWGVDHHVGFALGITMQAVFFVPIYLGGLACILVPQRKKHAAYAGPASATSRLNGGLAISERVGERSGAL